MEDYDFWLNLIINNNAKPVYVENTKLNYRVIENSMSKRDSTKYYFEIYLQILSKYQNKLPNEIYHALSKNIFTLERRLDELIKHVDGVTDYVLELQEEQEQSQKSLTSMKERLRTMKDQRDEAIQEQFHIRCSISYRLGNGLVTPLKYLGQIVKNPRCIKGVLIQIKHQLISLKRKAKSPKVYYYQWLRDFQ